MKHEYSISLLEGNHGIWLFVNGDNGVIFEQPGIKTVAAALEMAKIIIEAEENNEN